MITSHHRHDYRVCSCGEIAVDGGAAYLKRSAKSFDSLEELSEFVPFTKDELYMYIDTQMRFNFYLAPSNIADAEYCLNLWYPEKLDS